MLRNKIIFNVIQIKFSSRETKVDSNINMTVFSV